MSARDALRAPRMRAVLCIDVEPDARTPDPSEPVDWLGAERLFEDQNRLRELLGGQAINWFVRFDHQVDYLHGRARWPADRFGETFEELVGLGDEIGAHPHNWRWTGDRWLPDGTEAWAVHNAACAIETYTESFGHGPASFRYGDRFISDAVVRLLVDHPDVKVDLTTEPGVRACRGLVEAEQATGITRHVDMGLSRRYRPDDASVDIPSDVGDLTMVPLTVAAVPGTGIVDTLLLWHEPEQFERMLRVRLLDRELDHLAFAIRSDIGLLPSALERVEANLATLGASITSLEWVRASTMALQPGELSDQGPGPLGSLVNEIDEVIRVVHPQAPVVVPPVGETVRTIVAERKQARGREAALSSALADAKHYLEIERRRAADLKEALAAERRRAEELGERIDTIERTVSWRVRARALPILRPAVRARRGLTRRWRSVASRHRP